MASMSEADRRAIDKMIGECNFLRGLGYLYLVRSFGERMPSDSRYNPADPGVPLVDTLLNEKDQLIIPRSSLEDSWNEVVKNFTTAYNMLPEQWESAKLGAATKGAAAAYLGTVYTYFGMTDPEAMRTAKGWFDKAMQAGRYELEPVYAHNFDYEHENNAESIFEVQAETANDDEIGNYMWRRLGPEPIWWGTVNASRKYVNKFIGGYCVSQSLFDDIMANTPAYMAQKDPQIALRAFLDLAVRGFIDVKADTPEDFLALFNVDWDALALDINAAVKAVSPRTRFNILTDDPAWGTSSGKYFTAVLNAAALETDPRMYDTFYIPNRDYLYSRWDRTDTPILYTTSYYGFKKYIPNNAIESWSGEGLPGFAGNSPINQRIYRAGELFLQYAEVCHRLGDTGTAVSYLNKVRRRAWGEDMASSSPQPHDYTAAEGDFMEALVAEREKEMCLEGTLFFDYVRLGLDTREFGRGYERDVHSRLPIPLSERQLIGFDKLVQNTGY